MLGHSLPRMAIQPPLPTQESHPVSSTLTFLFSPGLYTTREDSCLTERKRLTRTTASQCPGYTASHGKLDLQKPYCRDDHQTSILCWDGALFFFNGMFYFRPYWQHIQFCHFGCPFKLGLYRVNDTSADKGEFCYCLKYQTLPCSHVIY